MLECQPLLDSSDMTIDDWIRIAKIIEVGLQGEGGVGPPLRGPVLGTAGQHPGAHPKQG